MTRYPRKMSRFRRATDPHNKHQVSLKKSFGPIEGPVDELVDTLRNLCADFTRKGYTKLQLQCATRLDRFWTPKPNQKDFDANYLTGPVEEVIAKLSGMAGLKIHRGGRPRDEFELAGERAERESERATRLSKLKQSLGVV